MCREPEAVKGVAISANDFFASSKSQPTKAESPAKAGVKKQLEVRSSPRNNKTAAVPAAANGTKTTKKPATTYKKYDVDDDNDLDAAPNDDEPQA